MAVLEYLNFDLLIERDAKDGYRVQVLDSPAGQATATFQQPVTDLEWENLVHRVGGAQRRGQRRSPEMEAAKEFGGKLFNTIFQDSLLNRLISSTAEAEKQERGLRIRLRLNDVPELINLPWEYLYNPALNRFLNLSVTTPVVRYLELAQRTAPLAVQAPLRMLVSIASPSDYPPLDVESEWQNLKSALGELIQRGVLVLDRLEKATPKELQKQLRRHEYHIFHFIGHGGFDEQAQDGVLLFEDEKGGGRALSGQSLGVLLGDQRSLRLVVLNASEGARSGQTDPYAGVAQSVLQQGVPAVIAMQFPISDEAANTFAHEFYTALADGYPVDAGVAEARRAIYLQGNEIEWGTPVLYMRVPDGRLFNFSSNPDLAYSTSPGDTLESFATQQAGGGTSPGDLEYGESVYPATAPDPYPDYGTSPGDTLESFATQQAGGGTSPGDTGYDRPGAPAVAKAPEPQDEGELLAFNGLDESTAQYRFPRLSVRTLAQQARDAWRGGLRNELQAITERGRGGAVSFGISANEDDLADSGWGVLFPAEVNPRDMEPLREALGPLLDMRRQQAGKYYHEFSGERGYKPGEGLDKFLERLKVGPGLQDPSRLPLHLLIVGNPSHIPLSFQQSLSQVVRVGRLAFSDVEGYANYSRNVMAAESSTAYPDTDTQRSSLIFAPTYAGDVYSSQLATTMIHPLVERIQGRHGKDSLLNVLQGEQATKDALLQGLSSKPAVFFAAAHGLALPSGHPNQLTRQGALVSADWSGAQTHSARLQPGAYLAGDDRGLAQIRLDGMLACLYASYAAGVPGHESTLRESSAPSDFLPALPARLFRQGAAGVIGPGGRLFTSPQQATSQRSFAPALLYADILDIVLSGSRLGRAVSHWHERLGELASTLLNMLEEEQYRAASSEDALAGPWTAFLDMLGLILLGDPAAKIGIPEATQGYPLPSTAQSVVQKAPEVSPVPSGAGMVTPFGEAPSLTSRGVERLRQALEEDGLGTAPSSGRVRIGAWNIRDFGAIQESWGVVQSPSRQKGFGLDQEKWEVSRGQAQRNLSALLYIAEITRSFDVLIISEVREDLSGVEALLKMLGEGWAQVTSAADADHAGRSERVAIVYNTRRVTLLVSNEIHLARAQAALLVHPPYYARFQAQDDSGAEFNVLSLFIDYNQAATKRRNETAEQLLQVLEAENVLGPGWERRTWLVGDFSPKDGNTPSLLQALLAKSLYIPEPLREGEFLSGDPAVYLTQIAALGSMAERFAGAGWFIFRGVVMVDLSVREIEQRISNHFPAWADILLPAPTIELSWKGLGLPGEVGLGEQVRVSLELLVRRTIPLKVPPTLQVSLDWQKPGLTVNHVENVELAVAMTPGQELKLDVLSPAPDQPGEYEVTASLSALSGEALITPFSRKLKVGVQPPPPPPPAHHIRLVEIQLPEADPKQPVFEPEQVFRALLLVENAGKSVPPADSAIALRWEWQHPDGRRDDPVTQTYPFPQHLEPGAQHGFPLDVLAPAAPGEYRLFASIRTSGWDAMVEPDEISKTIVIRASKVPRLRFLAIEHIGAVEQGKDFTTAILLENVSEAALPPESRVTLSTIWANPDGGQNNLKREEPALPDNFEPGAQHRLAVNLQAPASEGDYTLVANLSPLGWQGEIEPPEQSQTVTVLPSGPQYVLVISEASMPERVEPGSSLQVALTAANHGTRTWQRGEPFELHTDWRLPGEKRPRHRQQTLELPAAVAPGDDVRLEYGAIKALEQTGEYEVELNLIPLRWKSSPPPEKIRKTVHVTAGLTWRLDVWKAEMQPGEEAEVAIILDNTSQADWPQGLLVQVESGWRPDGESDSREIALPSVVPAGGTTTVSIPVRAPQQAGTYSLDARLAPVGWEISVQPSIYSSEIVVSALPLLEILEVKDLPLVLEAGAAFKPRLALRASISLPAGTGLQVHLQTTAEGGGLVEVPGLEQNVTLEGEIPAEEVFELQPDELNAPQATGEYRLAWQVALPDPSAQAEASSRLRVIPALPPAVEDQMVLPEVYAGDQPAIQYFNTFVLGSTERKVEQQDEHILDVQIVPARPSAAGALPAPAGDQSPYLVYLTLAEEKQRNYYRGPLALASEPGDAAQLGDRKAGAVLFQALFHSDQPDNAARTARGETGLPSLLDGYHRAILRGLQDEKDSLRIQLRFPLELPELHAVRWEYLWDPEGKESGPLACSERTPFARVLQLASSGDYTPPQVNPAQPLRILVAMASPANLADFSLEPIDRAEAQVVVDGINRLAPLVEAISAQDVLWTASRLALLKKLEEAALRGQPYHILHILCHGIQRSRDGRSCLVLHAEDSSLAEEVLDSELAGALKRLNPAPRLVVLASCLTALPANHQPLQGVARSLHATAEIPAVVAMQSTLEFNAAQFFAQRLYAQLVAHGEIDRAVNAARNELYNRRWQGPPTPKENSVSANQWGVPVLFMRLPDGQLFDVPQKNEDQFNAQATPYADAPGSQPGAMLAAAARNRAAALGMQISLSLPSLAQAFGQAVKAEPLAPARLHLFDQPDQAAQRWKLVWMAAQHRKHPARRSVLLLREEARQQAEKLLKKMLAFKDSTAALLLEFEQKFVESIWNGGGVTVGANSFEEPLGAGPAPGTVIGLPKAAGLRAGLRGWSYYSGDDLPETEIVAIQGNLTWRLAERGNPNFQSAVLEIVRELLQAQNRLAAFEAATKPPAGAPGLDEHLASYLLYVTDATQYPPYAATLAKNALRELGLENHAEYPLGYSGFCRLALDLLEDDALGFENLSDVFYFLQRLAAGHFQEAAPPRPADLRLNLAPVAISTADVDTDLVIRRGVLEQAAAALNAGKHIILIGPPGTGKTTLAEDLCRHAHDQKFNRGHYLVTATADWTTFDTIGGYMPESGDRLTFRPGIFLEAIAGDKWLLIDEINRADIDKAFGELFTVLSGQAVTLPYKIDGRNVRILPPGMPPTGTAGEYCIHPSWRIIGTMNIYDKASLFSMSYAFMRRFAFIDVPTPQAKPYKRLLGNWIKRRNLLAVGESTAMAAGAGAAAGALPASAHARDTLESLLDAGDPANHLMRHRALGPAIALDLIRYLRARTGNGEQNYNHSHLAEAISLYVLPQLDGLEQEHILEVYGHFHSLFKAAAAADGEIEESIQAVKQRIKELFPFVKPELWKGKEV